MNPELACFISPHGYGHATRTIALLQALRKKVPGLTARLFTVAPDSLFAHAGLPLTIHPVVTDVGLIQTDAFHADHTETEARLSELLPFRTALVERCTELCSASSLIICDISCLGIEVGEAAGVPSVLVENFTWDWIYKHLEESGEEMRRFATLFAGYYRKADYRIQTEPLCRPGDCDLRCEPMAREGIQTRDEIRSQFTDGVQKIVLITMGGIPLDIPFMEQLRSCDDYLFLIAGQAKDRFAASNVRLVSSDSPLHHPDLINCADLVICKSGYSTLAECQQTATPICAVSRNNFAESAVLDRYVTSTMNGTVIDQQHFIRGDWLNDLPRLMSRTREPAAVNGAAQAAAFIASLL